MNLFVIYYCICFRQYLWRFMMICNNNFHTELICLVNRFFVGNTTICSNNKFHSLLSNSAHSFFIQAKTFIVSMRNINYKVFIINPFEKILEYNRRRYSIRIIICIYGYFFIVFYGMNNPVCGFFHVFE